MGGKKAQFCEEKKLNNRSTNGKEKDKLEVSDEWKKKFTIHEVHCKPLNVITLVQTQTIYIDGMITITELILLVICIYTNSISSTE